jgi:hypothetical protein
MLHARGRSPDRIVVRVVLMAAFALAGASARFAHAAGRIVVSDTEFGTFASEKQMNGALKKQGKTSFSGGEAWTLNMMVFLGAPAGGDKINIVYYDVSKRPPEQVNFNEIGVKPDQRIVQVNGIAISKDMGFVKGHKYEVRATRLIGGKEKVYAKTTITLR